MSVRAETSKDKSGIATLIARTYREEGALTIEQTSILRSLDAYDEKLALVNEGEKGLNAFSLYTPVSVNKAEGAVVLAPFAVDPQDAAFDVVAYLEATFIKVATQNKRYIFVMAQLDDLAPLGFVFADSLGFTLEGNPPVSLLVKDLGEGEELSGVVNLPEVLLT